MTTVQYNNREILQSRCPLGNLLGEDMDLIERIKKAYVLSHPRVDSVEKVEIKWTELDSESELDAKKAQAILMVESKPTGMRSAPAETKVEALEDLAEQLGVAITKDRKQKLGFWRRALCLRK
ncbi:hypothetical protein J4E89_002531 [Alternaria sp. Ai002NY15]|nr:hypothetical protein J4E89_002531 [Alternaria sp. Ai002NY15]